METATFAAGCFWGVEAKFHELEGVVTTSVGYMGGYLENPTYEKVCTGMTGHAEVVRIGFDETVISYDELLRIFWSIHDPTTLNRQGVDVGSQYRSVIFYHSDEQKKRAEASKRYVEKHGLFKSSIVTTIEEAGPYYRAEEYHQKYLAKKQESF